MQMLNSAHYVARNSQWFTHQNDEIPFAAEIMPNNGRIDNSVDWLNYRA